MSKIIVTLKEPISNGANMESQFEFDNAIYVDNTMGVIWFNSNGHCGECPIPVANILGVAYKKGHE